MNKMTKRRVAELAGAQLDWAVAMASGESPEMQLGECRVRVAACDYNIRFCPSQWWEHGGPIIEREEISLMTVHPAYGNGWSACLEKKVDPHNDIDAYAEWIGGPTPLIAAMRAFVASKLGDEVEVPV